jgi:transcriptional regulator with XRE-family HTH domain
MGLARELDAVISSAARRELRERTYMADLGRRIRTAREDRGLSQREVAQTCGIATDLISRLENNRYTSPGLRSLLRIAEGLGTTVGALLPDTPANQPTAESSARARLGALLGRADAEQLELIVELAAAVVARRHA